MEKENRKKQISDAFIDFYLVKDIQQISIRELCERIPMTRTAFYYYYSDLYEFLQYIISDTLMDLEKINYNFYKVNLKKFDKVEMESCFSTLEYIKENRRCFKALMLHQGTNGFAYQWKKIIKRDFKKKYQVENQESVNMEIILELTASAIVGLYEYWLYHMDSIPVSDIAHGIYYQLCHSFKE